MKVRKEKLAHDTKERCELMRFVIRGKIWEGGCGFGTEELAPWYKSPHWHPERDPDRCPVGIPAGTCENTGVHSRR